MFWICVWKKCVSWLTQYLDERHMVMQEQEELREVFTKLDANSHSEVLPVESSLDLSLIFGCTQNRMVDDCRSIGPEWNRSGCGVWLCSVPTLFLAKAMAAWAFKRSSKAQAYPLWKAAHGSKRLNNAKRFEIVWNRTILVNIRCEYMFILFCCIVLRCTYFCWMHWSNSIESLAQSFCMSYLYV